MKNYTLGLYEKAMPANLTWREKLSAARNAGFDFVEISIDETEDKLARLVMGKKERLNLIHAMYEEEISIRTMCLSGHRKYPLGSHDDKVSRKGMEILEQAIELADNLGIRIIQLAGYDVYYEDSTSYTIAKFEDNLRIATQMAAKAGVILGFETMETEFMNTVYKAMKYVDAMQSSYLNVYPDVGNITNAGLLYGNDVFDDMKYGRGHLAAVHLKETLPGKFREVPFGTGHVDFDGMIETAWKLGVRQYVTEFWFTGNTDWRRELQSANQFIAEKLGRIEKTMAGNYR